MKGNLSLFSYVLYHQAYNKMTENKKGFGSVLWNVTVINYITQGAVPILLL